MDLVEIGYFVKTHGVKGHLILKSEADFYIDEVNACFIEQGGSKAPYFISEIKESNQGIIVLLEDISAIEKAKALIGKKVFFDSKFVEENTFNEDWLGFELIDKHFGSLGSILAMSDNGSQVLVSINYNGKEVILPMVEDFIENLDEAGKKIHYNAPEGLIQLYLDEK